MLLDLLDVALTTEDVQIIFNHVMG